MAATYLGWFSLLMVLLVSCHLFSPIECAVKVKHDLEVFNGDVDVTDQVFINGTTECLTSFDQADLPPDLRGPSVDPPDAFNVFVKDNMVHEFLVSGVQVKWSSPLSGADRRNLKGFFFFTKGEERYGYRCRLYIINQTAFDDVLDFRLNLSRFAYNRDNFVAKIYSLPPPSTMNVTGTYRSMMITTKNMEKITYPGKWIPTISFKTSLDQGVGTVDVYFTLAPKIPSWHLKEYVVMLLKCSDSLSDTNNFHIITKDTNTTDISAHWQFTGLNQDLYSVVVRVKNHEFPSTDSCVCQKEENNCDVSCGASQTHWFDLSGNWHPTPLTAAMGQDSCLPSPTTLEITTEPPLLVATPSTELPSIETSQKPKTGASIPADEDSRTSGIVIGVSVAVAVVIGLMLLAFICWRRRRGKLGGKSNSWTIGRAPSHVTHDARDIVRKVIYILATADHPASMHVLDAFCDLLGKYCQCDVISPRNTDLTQTCESVWVTASMSKSDCVVFVNFKGMEILVDAFLDSQTTTPPEPNHSLVHKALQFVFNSDHSNHRNFISVTFTRDWTQDRLALLNPKKFVLPRELTSLFAGVHNISEQCAEKYMRNSLPNMNRLENLPECQTLISAVKELSEFENDNKDWFDANYNIIHTTSSKLPASISSSVSSGCSSTIHDTMSDSLTDICPDSDSPVSVFGQPSFQQIPSSPDDGIGMEESNIFSISSIPGMYNGLMDGQSAVTVGHASDIQYSDTQKCGNSDVPHSQPIPPRRLSDIECDNLSTALKQTSEDSRRSQPSNSKDPQPLRVIVPPRFKSGLSNEDSISTTIADLNDSSSTWSKPSDLTDSCHIETETKTVKHRPAVVAKPPRLSLPTDNTSTMLEAFNDQVSVVSMRPEDSSAYEKDELYDSGLPEMSV